MTIAFLRHAALAAALLSVSPGARAAGALAQGEVAKGADLATVEVTNATRKDGILTVGLRFTAEPKATGFSFTLYRTLDEGYENVFLIAGDKKYFAMKDAEGRPLIPENFQVAIDQGKGRTFWSGRFAAPPPEVKEFSLVLPSASPLDAIPITDK